MMSCSPQYLPPEVRDQSAWYGPDMARRTDWIHNLSDADIPELEDAAERLSHSASNLVSISRDDFPLPSLGPRFNKLLDEVLNGRGFVLIRSLPVDRWTKRQAAIAFLGIGTHLGSLRSQNAAGHLLGHVTDLGRSSHDPNVRIYQTH